MPTREKIEHVAIIGAGIAGLTAAYRLRRSGRQVTILECQDRVGGRVKTLRSGFAEGLVAQAGPTRFPCDLERVQRYADAFGLELVPHYPRSGTVVAFFRGERIADYQPSADEFWGYTANVNRYPGAIERLLVRAALSARDLARRAIGRRPWLTYAIRGGTERLTEALARSCGARFYLHRTVTSLKQQDGGVEVQWSAPEGTGSLKADVAVCATPLSVLSDIAFSPPISEEKRKLARHVRFSSAIRIFLQMRRAYWRDAGHNGFAVTDTLGEIWDPNFDGPDSPALLVCYAKGELADRFSRLQDRQRVDLAVTELEKVFPGARAHFEHGTSFCWTEQSWIRGGWPQVRAGFAHRVKEFRRPENRVYFAGDYASTPEYLNMVEGAIESGEYVAEDIVRSASTRR